MTANLFIVIAVLVVLAAFGIVAVIVASVVIGWLDMRHSRNNLL